MISGYNRRHIVEDFEVVYEVEMFSKNLSRITGYHVISFAKEVSTTSVTARSK